MRNLTRKITFRCTVFVVFFCINFIIGLVFNSKIVSRNETHVTPCLNSITNENKRNFSLIHQNFALNYHRYQQIFKHLTKFFNDQPYSGAKIYTSYTILRLGLQKINIQPLKKEYGDVINDVAAFKYPIEIKECKQKSTMERTLFISILSAPDYFKKRQTIRKTWLRHFENSFYHMNLIDVIGYGFVLGNISNESIQYKIKNESKIYGDILQVEMDDNYYNLTRKSVAVLNWVNSKCSHADFILKIDDDSFINVRNLAKILVQLPPKDKSIYGKKVGDHDNFSRTSCKFRRLTNI